MAWTPEEAAAFYGKDAAEWLARWDAGRTVWTIEMGGIGPGYEQAIQVTVAEVLRIMLGTGPDFSTWQDTDGWMAFRRILDPVVAEVPRVKALGLSGAQYGAAIYLAARLYMEGPAAIMQRPELAETRLIQISRDFPRTEG